MTERFDEQHDNTMASLLRALETAPEVDVPADFAARVMACVPQKPRRATRSLRRARVLTPRYGRTAAFAALGVLLVAMVLMTRAAGGSQVWTGLQLLLLAQVCAYTLWFGFASWKRN